MPADIRALIMGRDATTGVPRPISIEGENLSVNVASTALPINAPIVGQAIIAVTGVAVPLSALGVTLPVGKVLITAHSDNGAAMTAGGSTVTNTVDGTGNGAIIAAGAQWLVYASDLSDVYVNGTIGDFVSFSAT
jgi:hypothetical protein